MHVWIIQASDKKIKNKKIKNKKEKRKKKKEKSCEIKNQCFNRLRI
jgi:hypothetical protein